MDFKKQLEQNVLATIKRARKDGTTGQSIGNLLQCTQSPPSSLPGAPQGTNAQWAYQELFKEVCKANRTIANHVTSWEFLR